MIKHNRTDMCPPCSEWYRQTEREERDYIVKWPECHGGHNRIDIAVDEWITEITKQ